MFNNKFNRCYDLEMDYNYMNVQADTNHDGNYDTMVEVKDLNIQKDNNMCCMEQPIMEPGTENCVHRTICHEVEHICPINTRIINHHVYKHVYKPCYTCCEENQVCHINEGNCNCFR